MNTFRMRLPSSMRIGIFCRLGSVELSLPVAVIVWLKLVCILLPASIYAASPSAYVDFNFASPLYSKISLTIGCSGASFSSTSAAVE